MKKKQQRTQLLLILFGLLLIFGTYFYYPYVIKENQFFKSKTVEKESEQTEDEQTSTFQDVEYKGFYDFDKPFIVKSEKAIMSNEEPDIIYMSNMHVTLYLNDGRVVEIFSDKGKYNKITYDCFFQQNVKAIDGETTILSDNLDLLATKNTVTIYNNVYLDYISGSLKADKINYDFDTKYFKVSMYDERKIELNIIK